jgi:hypothetical protein
MAIVSPSGDNWFPVKYKYPYNNDVEFIQEEIQFDTGHRFVLVDAVSGAKDLATNRDTLAVLSKSQRVNEFLTETDQINDIDLITNAPLKALDGKYVGPGLNDVILTDIENDSINNIFTFDFNDEFVTIRQEDDYLTFVSPSSIRLQEATTVTEANQFRYIYEGGNLTLFTNSSALTAQHVLSFDASGRELFASGPLLTTPTSAEILNVSVFDGTINLGFSGISVWVKYFNNYCDNNAPNVNLNLDESYFGINQNYLLTSPYKTSITVESSGGYNTGVMEMDFMNLKNVKTPEYEFTEAPNFNIDNEIDFVKRREYDRLYFGTNQDLGHLNPYLGYRSDTSAETFNPDKSTYFHYAFTAPTIPLSSAGFQEQGAIAGPSPACADKVLKKVANYANHVNWGNASEGCRKGNWLCSWLSGSSDCDPTKGVWKDRFFDPGYVTVVDAITSTEEVYIDNDPAVYDIDSQLTFDPGVLYQYSHLGSQSNNTIVENICANSDMILHYDDWAENIDDLSTHENDGLIVNFTDADIQETDIN